MQGRYAVIPPLTVMQRLFVDRYWSNGGNIVEAIEHAGYEGLPSPADKAKKGRRLLASKPIQDYIGYLKANERANKLSEDKRYALLAAETAAHAAAKAALGVDQKSADLKTGSLRDRSETPREAIDGQARGTVQDNNVQGAVALEGGASDADPEADKSFDGANCVDGRPGASRLYVRRDLGPAAAGMLSPPQVLVPADPREEYGRELVPKEIRELLANIARGAEQGMRDSRTRMRALELAMRNMGMLVDVSVKATVDANEPKQLTAEERAEQLEKLEGLLAKMKAIKGKGSS